MTEEDILAAKLKGYNVLIKFKDGEELLIIVDTVNSSNDDSMDWFMDAETFINGEPGVNFPYSKIAVCKDSIKYVKKL